MTYDETCRIVKVPATIERLHIYVVARSHSVGCFSAILGENFAAIMIHASRHADSFHRIHYNTGSDLYELKYTGKHCTWDLAMWTQGYAHAIAAIHVHHRAITPCSV